MEFFIVLAVLLTLAILTKWVSGIYSRILNEYRQNKASREYHMKQVADSLMSVDHFLNPDPEPVDYRENLLNANEELMQKRQLQDAMKEELGID